MDINTASFHQNALPSQSGIYWMSPIAWITSPENTIYPTHIPASQRMCHRQPGMPDCILLSSWHLPIHTDRRDFPPHQTAHGVTLSPIISGSNGKQPARFHTVHNIVVVIHISSELHTEDFRVQYKRNRVWTAAFHRQPRLQN